jgi:peptide/nickel transport system substrate-binding protein
VGIFPTRLMRVRFRRPAIAWFATAFFLSTVLGGTPALAGKADNSLRFASQDVPASVDPYFDLTRLSIILADHMYDTLIFRDPETGEFKGNLATAWRWTGDTSLELDLRQGVRFHNGAEFDADDVVYTFNFLSRPESRVIQRDFVDWIDHAERLDKYKVRIVAKRPSPAAIAYLAGTVAAIFPHEYYAKVGPAGMNERPIGTGPYRVVEHVRGKHIRFERNRDYFKDSPKAQPKIDRVEVRFIPDPQTRVAEAVAGGVDLIMSVAPDQAEQLRVLPRLQIVAGGTLRYAFLQMNTASSTVAPPLRDVRVRQAIMHAIDRDAMVTFIVGERTRVIHAECYPSQFGCTDEGVVRYPYDPAKARRLLAEAGYPTGFVIDFHAFRDRNQSEAIIGYLRAVGILARLRYLQVPAVYNAMSAGRVALVQNSWGSASISDVAASFAFFHNFTAFDLNRDPEIRDLLLLGGSLMDQPARKIAYAKALRLISERAYVLPLYTTPNYYVASTALVLKADTDEIPRFYEMSWK